jgi:hypothetical protein
VRRTLLFLVLLLSSALVMGGCGKSTPSQGAAPPAVSTSTSAQSSATSGTQAAATCPTANTVPLAKTKFVVHTGLAFGAFHRYLYKPLKAGAFHKGAPGRIKAFVKAALAAAFIQHEVRLAIADVRASPALCKVLIAPLTALETQVSGAVERLKAGDTSGVEQLNGVVGSLEGIAARNGVSIKEDPNPPIGG